MKHCWMCGGDFPDETRMIVPPREASHLCIPCSQTPRGQHLMQRNDRRYTNYYPGSHTRQIGVQKAMDRILRNARYGAYPPPRPEKETA